MPLLDSGSYRDVDLPTIVRMERRLPWFGWPHLPLGLLVCVAAILAAYRVPVSYHTTTALVAGGGVLGGFCGYGCGLVMVSTPDLVKTGRLRWRRTRVLRGLLFALGVLSAASLVLVAVCHFVLLAGASGLHPFTLSLQAGVYLVLAVANTLLAVLEMLALTKVLNGVSIKDGELTAAAAGLPA
ncbi:hypothetical protein [Amycolatopsis sp. DSM 110486]|uniref:hypothetical protein n=1 Tax=Amycolatopsis sp. DSM 110486 TaxID=2865832 RepID=UPI001C69F893|nr:hypothetical protein [Amycolatopsis sp. DSM 110486]QYN23508.1 hypothetical protein K1T34_14260 [Amycolatopsis sp. DSM 110486]